MKRSATRKARGSTKAGTKKPRAKKARLYTRYDPTTGQKVRVTADTFEYRDWPSRKPSKKKLAREAFKTDPIGTTGTMLQLAGKRSVEKIGEHVAVGVLRKGRGLLPVAAAGALEALGSTALVGTAALTAAALTAVFLQNASVKNSRLALGDRINALSREFVKQQADMARAYGVAHFADVPAEARNRLLTGYKDALAALTASARRVPQAGKFGQQGYNTIGR